MNGEGVAAVVQQLAAWARYGLLAVGWLVIAVVAGLACLAYLGLFDASHHLGGPGGMSHHLGIVGHAILSPAD